MGWLLIFFYVEEVEGLDALLGWFGVNVVLVGRVEGGYCGEFRR